MADPFVFVSGTLDLDPLYLPRWFVDAVARFQVGMVAVAICAPVAALLVSLLPAARRPGSSRAIVRASGLALAASAFLVGLLLHNFPDEVFVNLRQARILAESGRFSFYADRNVDGCVDLLYYALLAGLQRLGLDVTLGAILCGCACFAGTVYVVHGFAHRETRDLRAAWLVGAAAVVQPSLAAVAGSGWSSPFVGLLTALGIALWYSRLWPLAFALTGALALVRFDFSFYAVLTGACLVASGAWLQGRPLRRLLACYAMCLACAAATLAFWRVYYGHFVPTPIVMKAGDGGSFQRLLATLDSRWPALVIEIVPLLLAPLAAARLLRREAAALGAWLVPGLLHLAVVFSAGGDYMYGNRYHTTLFVACLFACAAGLGALLRGRDDAPAATGPGERRGFLIGVSVAAVVLLGSYAASSGIVVPIEKGMVVVRGRDRWFGNGLQAMSSSRITNHVLTSRFFSWLAAGRGDIGLSSLEVASIFYEYDGPSTDLLGFVNRAVATGPANPHPMGDGWDRRLDPHGWEREHPGIIWLDTKQLTETGFSLQDARALEGRPAAEILETCLGWNRNWWWTKDYFQEPFLREHYVARATKLNGTYHLLWLARADIAPELDRRLTDAGFSVLCSVSGAR